MPSGVQVRLLLWAPIQLCDVTVAYMALNHGVGVRIPAELPILSCSITVMHSAVNRGDEGSNPSEAALSGCGAVWLSASALEARGRRFKSVHPDLRKGVFYGICL